MLCMYVAYNNLMHLLIMSLYKIFGKMEKIFFMYEKYLLCLYDIVYSLFRIVHDDPYIFVDYYTSWSFCKMKTVFVWLLQNIIYLYYLIKIWTRKGK